MSKEIVIQSETNPEQTYILNLENKTCTCPSYYWRSQSDSYFLCKHLQKKLNLKHKPSYLFPEIELQNKKKL